MPCHSTHAQVQTKPEFTQHADFPSHIGRTPVRRRARRLRERVEKSDQAVKDRGVRFAFEKHRIHHRAGGTQCRQSGGVIAHRRRARPNKLGAERSELRREPGPPPAHQLIAWLIQSAHFARPAARHQSGVSTVRLGHHMQQDRALAVPTDGQDDRAIAPFPSLNRFTGSDVVIEAQIAVALRVVLPTLAHFDVQEQMDPPV